MPDPVVPPALITDPVQVAALLAGVLAAVFALARLKALARLFNALPPVLWAYFVPMLLTTAGVTPPSTADYTNPAYALFSYILLPMSLFLLTLSFDARAAVSLGRMATVMMLAGTLGIMLGAPIAYLAVGQFIDAPDVWKGFAALSGSWIGGTANLVAIAESLGLRDLSAIIVVDTVVGYGWMGLLIAAAPFQARFDQWTRADRTELDRMNGVLASLDTERRPATTDSIALLVGFGIAAAVLSRVAGAALPSLGDPTIISGSTWAVLIAVTVGLGLGLTRVRNLEADGASKVGYAALYLLLTSIGAQADLGAVLDSPLYLLAGVVWLAVHALVLLGAAKLFRSPLFFVATSSMANVGGAASTPIVAGVYLPAMAPVGLLMAVAGYILGVYGALAVAYVLGQLAGA